MRILLVNKFYTPRGGAERSLFDQERWLRAAGHEVHVFSQRASDDDAGEDSAWFVDEVRFDATRREALRGVGRFFWSETVRRRLTALVARHRPDVAILHNVYHHLGPAVPVTLRALDVPMLMILHDHKAVCPAYSGWRPGGPCSECRGQRFYRAALHGCGGSRVRGAILGAESYVQWRVFASYEKVARFAAPSEYLRQKLPEMGFPFRIELLRNAVEPPRDSPASFEERPYVGFAGRLSPEKGVEVLLRAAARLPRLSFRIAGDGPARGDLETLARSISARNVSFLGHLDSGTLEHELRRWRIAVLPSLSPENFPYSALDAMNHGVPVVGSALGGLVEMLGNGRGVLVAPGDDAALALAVGELHGERERLAELGENGRAFVEAECRPTSYVRRLSELLPTNDRTR